jgi:hypothetical protein
MYISQYFVNEPIPSFRSGDYSQRIGGLLELYECGHLSRHRSSMGLVLSMTRSHIQRRLSAPEPSASSTPGPTRGHSSTRLRPSAHTIHTTRINLLSLFTAADVTAYSVASLRSRLRRKEPSSSPKTRRAIVFTYDGANHRSRLRRSESP